MEIQALRHTMGFCEAECSECCLFGSLELTFKAPIPMVIMLLFLAV